MRRRLLITVTLALVLALPACADDRTETQTGSGPPTSIVSSDDKAGIPKDVTLGEQYVSPQGNSVTVHAFESPVAFGEAGYVIAGADVEGCAAEARDGAKEALPEGLHAGVSPRLFRLQLSDGTLQQAAATGVKEPILEDALLDPGECRRGWVTFRIPEQQKAVYVVLRSLSLVRWRVQ